MNWTTRWKTANAVNQYLRCRRPRLCYEMESVEERIYIYIKKRQLAFYHLWLRVPCDHLLMRKPRPLTGAATRWMQGIVVAGRGGLHRLLPVIAFTIPPEPTVADDDDNDDGRRRRSRWCTYAPRLQVLHHAFDGDFVQQYEVADTDIVVARHPLLLSLPFSAALLLTLSGSLTRGTRTRLWTSITQLPHNEPPRATDSRVLTVTRARACAFTSRRLHYLEHARVDRTPRSRSSSAPTLLVPLAPRRALSKVHQWKCSTPCITNVFERCHVKLLVSVALMLWYSEIFQQNVKSSL